MNERIYTYQKNGLAVTADPLEVWWGLVEACNGDLNPILSDAAREEAKEEAKEPFDANDRMAVIAAERELVVAGRKAFKWPGFNENGPGSGPNAKEVLDIVYHYLGWMEGKDESTATTAT